MRTLAGLSLVAAILFATVGTASPMDAGTAGQAQRGPGAWLHAKVERAQALVTADPDAARFAAEGLLAELRQRRTDVTELLDVETIDGVAETVVAIRNRAVLALHPGRAGAGETFIRSVVDGAVWSDWRWGVPTSVTLAQAILESDWGRSAPGNNLFGLKGEGPAGSTLRPVVEYRHGRRTHRSARFRAYADRDQAVKDHGRILGESARYARARSRSEDLAGYARALTGTYATDPRYASKLLRLIEARQLDRFDWTVPPPER